MNEIIREIEKEQLKENVDNFKVGDTVRVHGKIKEGNRERIQIFEGTVLKIQGGSNRKTFTVRKISNGVGVEKTWPLHSPNVEKVELVRAGKVRRAKLYYLRDRVGKKAKVKELMKQLVCVAEFGDRLRFYNSLRKENLMGYVEETNELKLDFKKITRMIGQEVIPVAIQN